MNDITIIGAGISGLTTAYLLKQTGIKAQILEARDRVGGRTHSVKSHNAVVDLGAAWIWPHHRNITQLAEQLGIETYPQYETGYSLFETPDQVQAFEPQGSNSPRRFVDGAQGVSWRLAQELDEGQVRVEARAAQITKQNESITITLTTGETIQTKKLILAIPPRVIANTITFTQDLPEALQNAQKQTHTWMGNSAKAIITFEKPFWREKQLSGFSFSHVGPLGELHDNSPEDCSNGVIFGFFAGMQSFIDNAEARKEQVIQQLIKLYGPEAENYIDYHDCAWWLDDLSSAANDRVPLRDHPIYGNPEFLKAYWDDGLYFSGAETAIAQGGYLDGAVEAALRIVQEIS